MKRKLSYAKAVNSDQKTVSGYISTYDWDRDMERFVKGAWDLSKYQVNPVVLWAHDHFSLPIGKNLELREDEKGLFAVTEFDDKSDRAMEVFSLFERKFLNAFSVGFMRKEFVMEDAGNGQKGLAITAAELYEYSPVSVPANPGALVERELAELAMKTLGAGAIEVLSTKSLGEQFLVVPMGPGDPEEPEDPKPEGEEPKPAEEPKLESALKSIIELARTAKGSKFDESRISLLTTATSVFNELINENKEPVGSDDMIKLKDVVIEFADVVCGMYPASAESIHKSISQIERAITGRAG